MFQLTQEISADLPHRACGLDEIHRVLPEDGDFVVGRGMEVAVRAVGLEGVEEHAITTPHSVSKRVEAARVDHNRPRQRR